MKTIRQQASELYKKNISAKLGYSITYAFFVLLAFLLAWFVPETLILTIPLFVIPLTYGLQLACADVNNGFPYKLKALFIGFGLYFSPKGFGAYSILMGFLKFLGIFVGFNAIAIIVLTPVYTQIDPTFKDLITQISSSASIEAFVETYDKLVETQAFINIEFISSSIGMFFATYMLLHHVMSNSIKAEMSFYTPSAINMRNNKLLHKIGFRTFRRQYYKDYYANVWPMIILYVLFFVGGCLFGYFVLASGERQVAGYQIRLIAFLLVLFTNIPLLPYFCDVMECLYKRHAKDYERASVNGIMDNLEELLKQKDLSDEERSMLNELLKKKEEEKQNTDKEKPDDEK